jgi:type I restriction enzyme S subunit
VSASRLVHALTLVSDRADGAKFKIGLDAIESGTGRLVSTASTEFDGEGIAFQAGDLLFGKLRPYLAKTWLANREGAAVGDFLVLRAKPIADARYLNYVLLSDAFLAPITAAVTGAKMPRTDWTTVKSSVVYLPPIDDQRAIANYLDHETAQIDVLVAKEEEFIGLLRERRSAERDALFAAGWHAQRTTVARILRARPSYGVLVPQYVNESDSVPFIRVGDLHRFQPHMDLPRIALSQSMEYRRTRLEGGEVLLGVVGRMGIASVAPRWLAGANVARAVAVLRLKEHANAELLSAWLGSGHFLRQAVAATSGDSVQPTLGMTDLAHFELHWPVDPAQAKKNLYRLDDINALIVKAREHIALAGERRSALITAAVTGQFDVRLARKGT